MLSQQSRQVEVSLIFLVTRDPGNPLNEDSNVFLSFSSWLLIIVDVNNLFCLH